MFVWQNVLYFPNDLRNCSGVGILIIEMQGPPTSLPRCWSRNGY